MKILQILTDTNVGGAGIWLLNFLKAFDRESFEAAVVLPRGAELIPAVKKLGVRVIEADNIADRSFSLGSIGTFMRIMAEEKPEVIHTHACISARIAGRLKNVRIVNTRHCLEDPKRFPKRFIYRTVNNTLSDAVIGVSEAVVHNLIQDGIRERKVHLVYNGIAPLKPISPDKQINLRRQYGLDAGDVIVGIVARLEPVKNHELFLEAAKFAGIVNPRLRFLIVGTGSRESELKAMAKKSEIAEKIIFTGYIQDVNDIMNIIDIPVITSHKEALSIALIEGMSLAKPCIATDSGGTKEVVYHGRNGIIVPNNDAVNLSLAMIDLGQNARKRAALGAEGQKIAREKFGIAEMARQIETIYMEITGRKDEANESDGQ